MNKNLRYKFRGTGGWLTIAIILLQLQCVGYSKYEQSPVASYYQNRAMDARDIGAFTIGYSGFGVWIDILPISIGLGSQDHSSQYSSPGNQDMHKMKSNAMGLEHGEFGIHNQMESVLVFFSQEFSQPGSFQTLARARQRSKGSYPGANSNGADYGKLRINACLLVCIKMGIHPFEMLDFLVGLFGFDLYEDDVFTTQSDPRSRDNNAELEKLLQ